MLGKKVCEILESLEIPYFKAGSRALGYAQPNSDLDLAILVKKEKFGDLLLDLQALRPRINPSYRMGMPIVVKLFGGIDLQVFTDREKFVDHQRKHREIEGNPLLLFVLKELHHIFPGVYKDILYHLWPKL